MRFEVLGPLRAFRGATELPLGSAKQRAVLAVLLLKAGWPVPRDQIVAGVWGAKAPDSAMGLVATYVAGLRRALEPDHVIESTAGGYRVTAEANQIDLYAFDVDMATSGRVVDLDERAAAVVAALDRWRGVALEGVPGPHAERVRAHLAERWLAAVEQRIDIDIARGRHADVLCELFQLTGENPRREPLHGMLIRALHATGRKAEALTAYHQLRRVLVDELGVEPGASLRELHRRILLDEPSTIRSLPADPAGFAGREAEVNRLSAVLTRSGVAVVSGAAGSGKTTLAVRVAHAVAPYFPDGQLFARGPDLHGSLLKALRVEAEPGDQAAAVRAALTGRRMLLVLDDVVRGAEVQRILPDTPGCAAIVTSRAGLSDLSGHVVHIGGLDDEAARAVLASAAGGDRVGAEPQAAARIVELCAGMPGALRAASVRLAARPQWTLRQLADRMGTHDIEVRRDFQIGYDELSTEDARIFRLLGSLPGDYVQPELAAAVLRVPLSVLARTMDLLADKRLVEVSATGHRLLPVPHLVAREHAERLESPAELDDLRDRALGYYRAVAFEADLVLRPGRMASPPDGLPSVDLPTFRDTRDAITWWEAERSNLVALALSLARRTDAEPMPLARLLTDLRGFLHRRGHWTDWENLGAAVLRAGQRRSDERAQALALLELGSVATMRNQFAVGTDHLTRGARLFNAFDDPIGQGRAMNNIAIAYMNLGRFADAALALRQCLELQRSTGDKDSEAITLDNLAMLHLRRGAYGRAASASQRSIALRIETGTENLSAFALSVLGQGYSHAGDHRRALPMMERALEYVRADGNRYREAYALADLGEVWHLAGRSERALAPLESALAMHVELNDEFGIAETRRLLVQVRGGEPPRT